MQVLESTKDITKKPTLIECPVVNLGLAHCVSVSMGICWPEGGRDDEYLRVFLQVGERCNESCTIGYGELKTCPRRSYVVRCEIVIQPEAVSTTRTR